MLNVHSLAQALMREKCYLGYKEAMVIAYHLRDLAVSMKSGNANAVVADYADLFVSLFCGLTQAELQRAVAVIVRDKVETDVDCDMLRQYVRIADRVDYTYPAYVDYAKIRAALMRHGIDVAYPVDDNKDPIDYFVDEYRSLKYESKIATLEERIGTNWMFN